MKQVIFSPTDVLAKVIHTNYRVLVVLDRLDIKLGLGNKTIATIAQEYNIDLGAFLLILNLFCEKDYQANTDGQFKYIPDLLVYLKNSHVYFSEEIIPQIQQNIKDLVHQLHDSKAEMVNLFYNNYIQEVTEHFNYENEVVFPYVEQLYNSYLTNKMAGFLSTDFTIHVYGDHHENIEDTLNDLKNILIRHLPQKETGNLRRLVLEQLFELELDLNSHTKLEDEILIPLVKSLESRLLPCQN